MADIKTKANAGIESILIRACLTSRSAGCLSRSYHFFRREKRITGRFAVQYRAVGVRAKIAAQLRRET